MKGVRGVIAVLAGLCLLSTEGAVAQMNRFQTEGFSQQAVVLVPPPVPDGSDATRLFADWGITFSTESGQAPVTGTRSAIANFGIPPAPVPVILGSGPNGEDTGALIIHCIAPVRRLYLSLGAEPVLVATVRYFDPEGVLMGELSKTLLPEYFPAVPFVVEAEEGQSIGRIEVEYDNPAEPETLFLIDADFVTPPSFRSCVTQVAHGLLPDQERTLETQLSVTNSAVPDSLDAFHAKAVVSLEFRDSAGTLWPAIADGEPTSRLDFTLQDVESKIVRTTNPVSELDQGYACATSNYPLELAAIYRILDADGRPVSEAGIQGTVPGYRFFGIVQKDRQEETNTALALANVSAEEATVSIRFLLPQFERREVEWVLVPGEQRAAFVDELVPELADRDFDGSIEIVGDGEIVGTVLRTIRGVVSSSLPLGRSPTGDK
jgi:hypothetical protein